MALEWILEQPAMWDADKARIVGAEDAGVFDRRFKSCRRGDLVPGTWWRAADGGQTIGYGWLDVVWGDAEISLATAPEVRGRGVGSFIMQNLEREARQRDLRYLYNSVRPTHPERERVTAWLKKRGFQGGEDGSLLRSLGRG